jgi:hypothetical protein
MTIYRGPGGTGEATTDSDVTEVRAIAVEAASSAAAAAASASTAANASRLTVGTVTTGAEGSSANVTIAGSAGSQTVSFAIPRGNTGATGAAGTIGATGTAATISVGTVATGAAGSSVAITNSGTTSAAVLNFTIPRGDTGSSGDGSGNVIGPASSINNNIALFNGTTGTVLKESSSLTFDGTTLTSSSDAATVTPLLSARRSAASGNAVIAQFTSSGTTASPTAVVNGRGLGRNEWFGFDGTSYATAAAIVVAVDGAVSTGIMPGRFIFQTTSTSGGSPVERVRIDSSGNLGIGTSSPFSKLTGIGNAGFYRSAGTSTGDPLGAQLYLGDSNFSNSYYYNSAPGIGAVFSAPTSVAGSLAFYTYTGVINARTEQMRLDSSGNLGLGVTPSAWSGFKALQFGVGSISNNGSGDYTNFASNAFNDGTSWKYINSTSAMLYQQLLSQHAWFTAPSGTAGNAISFTQAMTLDASGRLGIGVTNPNAKLEVYDGTTGEMRVTNLTNGFQIYTDASATTMGTFTNAPLVIRTNSTERARINTSGQFETGIAGTASAPSFTRTGDLNTGIFFPAADTVAIAEGGVETTRFDASGNVQVQTGSIVVWSPAHASISSSTTLTNAQIQSQIIVTSGTNYTVNMPLGTTLETLVPWASVNLGYDFTVINNAGGVILMAVLTGVTAIGNLSVVPTESARFRIRRTAANTFVLYRMG